DGGPAAVGAVVGGRAGVEGPVALGGGGGGEVVQGAWISCRGGGIVEAAALAGVGGEFLGVDLEAVAVGVAEGELALGVADGLADLDDVELVLADAAVEDLLLAGLGVEAPGVGLLNEGDGEGVIVVADRKGLVVV